MSDLAARMAELASRVHDADEHEREYASRWLDRLWRIYDAARTA